MAEDNPKEVIDVESEMESMLAALEIGGDSEKRPPLKNSEETDPSLLNYKRSLKSREAALTSVDDLLISGGARLILLLPIIVVILFGFAQSFRDTEPEWWSGSVSGLFLDLSISKAIYLLALVIMVADLVLLFVLHNLMWLTRRIFKLESDEITSSGVTFRSAHGYTEMKAVIDGSTNQLNLTSSLMVVATLLLSLALNFSIDTQGVPVLIALSTGALLSGHSIYMVSDRPRFNTVHPWGLLDAFSPPIHPALLNKPFTDVIRAHVDPLLAVRVSKYVSSFNSDLRRGTSLSDLQEYILQMLHMLRSGIIDDEEFQSALESVVDENTIGQIINHPELGEETLERLLSHARNRCAPFFRLNDRLRMHINSSSNSGIWFAVDMENLTLGQANLFAFVLNQTDQVQDLVIRVQTPDFRPNECVYRLKVNPHDGTSLDGMPLYHRLSESVLESGIIWQTLIPSSMGDATVTVRLEDSSGNLISGKVLTAQVRSDLFTRLRMTTGAVFMIGAALAIVSPLLPFVANLLGL